MSLSPKESYQQHFSESRNPAHHSKKPRLSASDVGSAKDPARSSRSRYSILASRYGFEPLAPSTYHDRPNHTARIPRHAPTRSVRPFTHAPSTPTPHFNVVRGLTMTNSERDFLQFLLPSIDREADEQRAGRVEQFDLSSCTAKRETPQQYPPPDSPVGYVVMQHDSDSEEEYDEDGSEESPYGDGRDEVTDWLRFVNTPESSVGTPESSLSTPRD